MGPALFCKASPVARSRRVQPLGLFIQIPDRQEMVKAKKAKAAPIVEAANPAFKIIDRRAVHAAPPSSKPPKIVEEAKEANPAFKIIDRRAVHAAPPKPSPPKGGSPEGGSPKTPFSEPPKIIGERKEAKPAPSLVGSGGESLTEPTVPTTDVRSSAQPKLFGPSGQQVYADPPKPSPFEGGLPKTPFSEPPKIIGERKEERPTPSLMGPGTKPTSGVISSPHPSSGSSGPVVDPSGKPVTSKLTEGPGAARPKPTIYTPGSEKPAGGGKIEVEGSAGSTPKSTMTADELQWNDAIASAKKREAKAAQYEAESRPLDFKPKMTQKPASGASSPASSPVNAPMSPQQQKMMAAASGGSKKEGEKPSADSGSPPTRTPRRGPNVLGNFGIGYQIGIQGDPAATVSLLGHRAAGVAHGLLSPGADHEQSRMQREAYQQRAELLRQSSQHSQSAMQRSLSISARPDTPPIRSGLRRS